MSQLGEQILIQVMRVNQPDLLKSLDMTLNNRFGIYGFAFGFRGHGPDR